ncbi:hypothetical protein CQ12_16705 [Bradyrhizobium jicamae]|uniref:Uncharacterized protein n=1 Tax=Bradyrhizobium jicamae TaxID=280332 RepID=A0A0R3LM39_9BRAD|nr:hypothetical protein CQ12_16705 [Bradyrhizobium jicamae]
MKHKDQEDYGEMAQLCSTAKLQKLFVESIAALLDCRGQFVSCFESVQSDATCDSSPFENSSH